jgi:glycosyltransferase involved in cell wall biosynthesis
MNEKLKPKVTIVTAVYNKEELIHTCVASVLSQNFKNFELILVDDGSPDNCPQICDDYARSESRIKVIHKANGGYSDARNNGIVQSNGEYITILDADDYFSDNNCLSAMLEIAESDNSDIVITDFLNVWENKKQPRFLKGSGMEVLEYLIEEDIYHPTPCSRLFKKTIFDSNLFKKLICDDEEWMPQTFFRANVVSILPRSIYVRTTPDDSVTRIETEENYFRKAYDKVYTTVVLIDFFENEDISLSQKKSIYKRFISLYLSSLHIYTHKLTSPQLKAKLLVILEANKHVLKSSKVYNSYSHHLVALIIKYFGLRGALLFFKLFSR